MPESINWLEPWFAPWRDCGEQVVARCNAGSPLHEALNEPGRAPVRFVPQSGLAQGEAYETHIFRTGSCPTRDNMHDFFNGLCWLRFPRTKKALNALQAAQIAGSGISPVRGAVRDAITVFDENGAFLRAPGPLWDALVQRDWRRLFIDLRPLWDQASVIVFGHALLEKLLKPRKDLTAHVWCAPMAASSTPGEIDASIAAGITALSLARKPFTPLPLMGIPGWCPENQNFSFYDDSLVFRPARRTAS
jgi:hypothetical protein